MTDSTPQSTSQKSETGKLAHGFRRLLRYALKTMLGLLIVVTVYLTAGRLLMKMLEGNKAFIEAQLGEMTGTNVVIAELRGGWFRLSPLLELDGLEMSFPDQSVSQLIQHLDLKLDVLSSILHGGLVVERVTLDRLAIEFVEDEEGHWTLAGFSNGGSDYTEEMLDLILNISDLQLSEARLIFNRASGSQIALNNAYVQLQNFDQEHHLQVQLRLEEQASPLRFSLVIEGDPRTQYTANAYLWMNHIDFSKLLDTDDDREFITSRLSSSAEIWMDYGENRKWEIRAELNDTNFEGHSTNSGLAIELTGGRVDVTAVQSENKQWQVWLQKPQFDFFGGPWESGDFFIEIDLQNEAPGIELVGDWLDLNIVSNMLDELSLPEAGRRVLEQLHPSGILSNIKFSTDFSGNYPDGFDLSANLTDGAAGAWSAAPSMEGVAGFVQANQVSGFFELDSRDFTIHLPKVFKDSWHYDSINSRVHWYVTNDIIRVSSGVIDAQNEGIHGRVQFELKDERNELGGWNAELSVLVGALRFDASQKSLYLPTLSRIRNTMSWLDEALIAGDVSNSGFIYRGIIAGNGAGSSTIQTFYNVDNGVLKFLPEWPELKKIKAFVKVSNNDVDISAESAEILDINIGPTQGTIRLIKSGAGGFIPSPSSPEGSWLSISGSAQTSTALGLDFIRNSPVQGFVGDYVNNWRAEGQVEVGIELGIPLNNDNYENNIQLSVLSNNSILEMPDYGLTFNEIEGEVNYNSASGLSAKTLKGSLFGYPIVSEIKAVTDSLNGANLLESGTHFLIAGSASVKALKDWTGQSDFIKTILGYASGETAYSAEFALYNTEREDGVFSRLTLKSDLSGLTLDLPEPFYKELADSRQLKLETEFLHQQEVYSVSYGESFYTQVLFKEGELLGGDVFFGSLDQVPNNQNPSGIQKGVQIRGELGYLNFEDWYAVGKSFSDDIQTDPSSLELVDLVDVNIEIFDVFSMELLEVYARVDRAESGWNIFMENALLRGRFGFPDDSKTPLEVNLDYLHFPEEDEKVKKEDENRIFEEESPEDVDVLANINPGELPDINFNTQELTIGQKNMGAWEFALRSNGSGATISNLKMTSADAGVSDLSNTAGANLDWHYVNGKHTSSFNGLLHAGDLATVLPSWGYDASVQSENANFVSNLQWSGSPAAFSIKTLSGQMDINISNGRFVDINSDSARVFAAFNFDAVERRLKLDFSDLYEKGLSFDTISGKLNFDNGFVNTDGRFLIQGTSSTINIEGEIDLINETIDADMLVNIPLSQNIAVIAGFLGAWPIAIGSYLAGKIFEEQLEQFTTVLYRLEGPWSELNAGFESDDSVVENELEEVGLQ